MSADQPSKVKVLSGGRVMVGGFVLVLALVLVVKAVWKSEKTSSRVGTRTGPYETVQTSEVSLAPGEPIILKSFIGGSGPLTYLFEFTKITDDSILDYSRHGRNGEFGGDKIGGAGWCRPAKANTITGDGESNSRTYYIRIKNSGPDEIAFKFHLKGYRVIKVPDDKSL